MSLYSILRLTPALPWLRVGLERASARALGTIETDARADGRMAPRGPREPALLVAVRGWSLSCSGRTIERVAVTLDGGMFGSAELNHFMPDVWETLPGDGHSFGGFNYFLDSHLLSNGSHVSDVEVTDSASQRLRSMLDRFLWSTELSPLAIVGGILITPKRATPWCLSLEIAAWQDWSTD